MRKIGLLAVAASLTIALPSVSNAQGERGDDARPRTEPFVDPLAHAFDKDKPPKRLDAESIESYTKNTPHCVKRSGVLYRLLESVGVKNCWQAP